MGDTPETESARAGRPRDARLDAAIVAATLELLEERGYHDLTLTAVAERAGTTTPAIYRRWASKSELVAHAVFRTDGDDVVADTGDLRADLVTMVRWSVDKIYRPVALAAIGGLLGESRADRHERSIDAATAALLVTARLDRARDAGEIRPGVDTHVLAALVDGPVLHAALSGMTQQIDDDWITSLVDIVLDGAAATPSSPSAPTRHRRASAPPTSPGPGTTTDQSEASTR